MSDWRERVYECLMRVPRGRVVTYGGLARAAGCGSPRAVGRALRDNPCLPRIPCHRVIRSDLSIGGYQGSTSEKSLDCKRNLLAGEGVEFDASGKLCDPTRLLY